MILLFNQFDQHNIPEVIEPYYNERITSETIPDIPYSFGVYILNT